MSSSPPRRAPLHARTTALPSVSSVWRRHCIRLAAACILAAAQPPALAADALGEAQQLLRQGKQAEAMAKVDAYLASNPRDAQGRFLKGLILTEQNAPVEALAVFVKLTEDYPELPEPYNNLAVLYAQQKQYEKARTALEMAIRTHPAYAIAHENLGDVYAKLASQAYDKALQIDSGNSLAQSKLSLIRELISVSARQSPRKPSPRSMLGGGTRLTAADVTPGDMRKPLPVARPAPVVATAAAPSPPPRPAAAKAPTVAAAPAPATTPAATAAPIAASAVAVTPPQAAAASPAEPALASITTTLESWAAAWSRKDVPAYLAHYDAAFSPDGKTPRAQWASERAARVGKPGEIEVALSDLRVTLDNPSRAVVQFRQQYRSANLSSVTSKTVVLQRVGERWLIIEERVG